MFSAPPRRPSSWPLGPISSNASQSAWAALSLANAGLNQTSRVTAPATGASDKVASRFRALSRSLAALCRAETVADVQAYSLRPAGEEQRRCSFRDLNPRKMNTPDKADRFTWRTLTRFSRWIQSNSATAVHACVSRPSISFRFCTAAPDAPLPRLSNLATSTT
jgi:hypothetical protein